MMRYGHHRRWRQTKTAPAPCLRFRPEKLLGATLRQGRSAPASLRVQLAAPCKEVPARGALTNGPSFGFSSAILASPPQIRFRREPTSLGASDIVVGKIVFRRRPRTYAVGKAGRHLPDFQRSSDEHSQSIAPLPSGTDVDQRSPHSVRIAPMPIQGQAGAATTSTDSTGVTDEAANAFTAEHHTAMVLPPSNSGPSSHAMIKDPASLGGISRMNGLSPRNTGASKRGPRSSLLSHHPLHGIRTLLTVQRFRETKRLSCACAHGGMMVFGGLHMHLARACHGSEAASRLGDQ